MDAARFDAITRYLSRRFSRRRMLPGIAAVLGVGLAGAGPGPTRAEKPEPCPFVYYTTTRRRVHGYGYADFASPCAPCATGRDCESTDFPHCLRDYIRPASGTRFDFVRTCGPYEIGVCGRVNACVPGVAQAGLAR
jgi:hypothetical protein